MSLRPAWAKLVEGKVGKGRRDKREEREIIFHCFLINEMWSVIGINDKTTQNIAKHIISIIL